MVAVIEPTSASGRSQDIQSVIRNSGRRETVARRPATPRNGAILVSSRCLGWRRWNRDQPRHINPRDKMKITEPGIYYDVATADYFADPCPTPSFTQSL